MAKKRIIVDAFGGDNAPDEIIKGCRMAADELDVQIILTGREDEINLFRLADDNFLRFLPHPCGIVLDAFHHVRLFSGNCRIYDSIIKKPSCQRKTVCVKNHERVGKERH